MTHLDAQSNMQLAKSSKQLAEAARKDSSAMKSIAVLTMVFLPGTFFAALFAVPSMPASVQHFGIYWAFSGGATALMFIFWAVWHWYDSEQQQKAMREGAENRRLADE
jgi:Mg2+ and Co2+ transporter CorA